MAKRPEPWVVVALSLWKFGGSLKTILSIQKFEKSRAWIEEDVVAPGDWVHFSFEQQCLAPVEVKSIQLFLVFREVAHYDDHKGKWLSTHTRTFDRLVHSVQRSGSFYGESGVVEAKAGFQIPDREMGIRHPFPDRDLESVQCQWVVKVRLELDLERVAWREYVVDVQARSGPLPPSPGQSASQPQELFDVFLVGEQKSSFLKLPEALRTLVPHLSSNWQLEKDPSKPALLLERQSREAAESVKAGLEAAGGIVEIRRGI